MKLAAISDIHGNLLALQAVLKDIDAEGVDLIVNCGDALGGPLESAKTADLLMTRSIPMIAGNHERQLLTLAPSHLNRSDACTASELNESHRRWLAAAPSTMWLADDVFVCHGTPSSDVTYWLETVIDDFGRNGSVGIRPASMAEVLERLGDGRHRSRASLIICGHTHTPRVVQIPVTSNEHASSNRITIVNARSVGLQGYDDEHPHQHWIQMGSPHARYALLRRERAGWHVQVRCVPYDFEPMAQLAQRRGRQDWATPLRSGMIGS